METFIVVPCFNEERRLPMEPYRRFARSAREVHIHFVNDGSSDQTEELLDELCRDFPGVFSSTSFPQNQGKAEAVRQGMLVGFDRCISKIGYWDADLATPLEAIYDFVDVLDRHPNCDLVLGSRLPLLGRAIHRNPKRQWLGNRFAHLASLALGIAIRDTQCGAKLFRANERVRQLFEHRFQSRWIFDIEVLARFRQQVGSAQGLSRKLFELPLDAWEDVADSKLRPRDMLTAPWELFQIYCQYLLPWSRPFGHGAPNSPVTAESKNTIPFPIAEKAEAVPLRHVA